MECTVWDLLGTYSEHMGGFRVKGGRVQWEAAHYNDGHKLVYIWRLVPTEGNRVKMVGRYVPHDTVIELVGYSEFDTEAWRDFFASDQQMKQNPCMLTLITYPDDHAQLWAQATHPTEAVDAVMEQAGV